MTRQERRALLGEETVADIHRDVDAGISRYGIPDDAISDLRLIFGPVLDRLDLEPARDPGALAA